MAISCLKTKEGSLIEEIPLWTDVETVESQALDQLRNVAASLPWLAHLSVMPNVHYGNGATVGSVIAYSDELVEIVTELKPAIICVKG